MRRSILLLRYDRIGDMITSTALVRAITEATPNVIVDVLASPANAEIIQRQKQRGDIIIYDRTQPASFLRLVVELRSRKYHAVLDGFVLSRNLSTRRALIMIMSGARHRIGLSPQHRDFVYNVRISRETETGSPAHHVDVLALLAKPFGIDISETDWRPAVNLTTAERDFAERAWARTDGSRRFRFLVNISAAQDEVRHWPRERYASAIRHLQSVLPESSVLVIGLPDDLEDLSWIARQAGVVALSPGLFESFALVESADLFLTPDTGLVHAASAFQTPTIALMRSGAEPWVPYRTRSRNLFPRPSSPVNTIELNRVEAAIDEMLAELGGVVT